MEDKFSLGFVIVNKAATHRLQKDMGLDANPCSLKPLSKIPESTSVLQAPHIFF